MDRWQNACLPLPVVAAANTGRECYSEAAAAAAEVRWCFGEREFYVSRATRRQATHRYACVCLSVPNVGFGPATPGAAGGWCSGPSPFLPTPLKEGWTPGHWLQRLGGEQHPTRRGPLELRLQLSRCCAGLLPMAPPKGPSTNF